MSRTPDHRRTPILPLSECGESSLRTRLLSQHKSLARHDSAIEQFVASHPLRPQDILYPTNIMVKSSEASTADTLGVSREARMELLLETLPAQKLAGIVTIAVFAGYAALFSLQHVIKVTFKIPDDDSLASHNFSFAITSMYIWNLVFRVGHNFILYRLPPRRRSLCGLVSMMVSMLILSEVVFANEVHSIAVVAAAYAFGGMAIGTFETNYSVVLAALGNRTKIYGISGIPIGIFLVIVPGFIAVASGMPVVWVYYSVLMLLLLAVVVLLFFIEYPVVDSLLSCDEEEAVSDGVTDKVGTGTHNTHSRTSTHNTHSRTSNWIWKVISVGIVFTLNMLFVSAFSPGVLLYLYNGACVDLSNSLVPTLPCMPTGYFFALFSSFGFVADVVSRRRIYATKPKFHPIRYLVLTSMGILLIIARTPLVAPMGTFLVFFANGSIYAQSCRWLDLELEASVSVMANSVFFFLGDCGSVLGAILIPYIRDLMAAG